MFSDDPGEPLPDHAGDGADLIVEFVVD
jgi:hypothetical protein